VRRLACVVLVAAACTQRTQLLPVDGGVACSGLGTPVQLGNDCAPALAARTLRYAVCTCQSLVFSGNLTTEAMPPMMGPGGGPGGPGPGPGPAPPPAAVGSDGSIQIGGQAQLAGTAVAVAAMSFDGAASLFGNLHSGGSVSATHLLVVAGDAFAAGDVLGRVDIAGTLHVAPGANVASNVAAHDIVREDVSVLPPCDCGTPALDVAALVTAARSANADASIGLDPASSATTLDLPCGNYYLSSLSRTSELDIAVHGRAALFIGGDVTLGGGLRVSLDSGATLDLVVAGNFDGSGGIIGTSEGAGGGRVRLWLGGSAVRLGGDTALALALYAPRATLSDDGGLGVDGALFVDTVAIAGDLAVRYDNRLAQAAGECNQLPPPPIE
jgi:hypothetical protein